MISEKLTLLRENFKNNASPEAKKIIMNSLNELKTKKILETSLKIGDKIPNFTLSNSENININSDDFLSKGQLIINFYRGSWWPYCAIELGGFQDILTKIRSKGAEIIALSPELPEKSSVFKKKLSLDYEILTDKNNEIAKAFGISFTLDDELIELYKEFSIDLKISNGTNNWELPVPATYIISREGIILFSWLDLDYTKRVEPEDIYALLSDKN